MSSASLRHGTRQQQLVASRVHLGSLPDLPCLWTWLFRYGVQTWAWTLDTPKARAEAAAAGVRVMCTNDPAGALKQFETRQACVESQCAPA